MNETLRPEHQEAGEPQELTWEQYMERTDRVNESIKEVFPEFDGLTRLAREYYEGNGSRSTTSSSLELQSESGEALPIRLEFSLKRDGKCRLILIMRSDGGILSMDQALDLAPALEKIKKLKETMPEMG